jgi:hypothetical protein
MDPSSHCNGYGKVADHELRAVEVLEQLYYMAIRTSYDMAIVYANNIELFPQMFPDPELLIARRDHNNELVFVHGEPGEFLGNYLRDISLRIRMCVQARRTNRESTIIGG